MFVAFVVAVFTVVLLCSTGSVSAVSLGQEGLVSLPVGTQRYPTHWVEFAMDPDSPRPLPTVHTREFIPAGTTMNWPEMATQTIAPPSPKLRIYESIKFMEPPKLSVITEGLTHRSPLLAGAPFIASPTESPITSLIAASTPTASPTTGVSAVNGPGSVTTGYAVISAAYAPSDTACTGRLTSGYAYVLGVCIPGVSSNGAIGYMFTADVRFIHFFFPW